MTVSSQQLYDLDTPILGQKGNPWTLRNAVEGLGVFGGIGSGKTSGSGRFLALKYLRMGFGGLVLTVKPDERTTWEQNCRETGREDDLIVLEPKGQHSFNFLDYEANRSGNGAGLTENIVKTTKTVINADQQSKSASNDAFWEDAQDMLLFNTIDLCLLSYKKLNIDLLSDIAQTMPKSKQDYNDEKFRQKAFGKAYFQLRDRLKSDPDSFSQDEIRLIEKIDQYFWETFVGLNEKTRSIIEHSFWGFLFRISRDPIYSMMCNPRPNITPEDSLKGKIILIDLPVKLFDKVGRDAQILFKYVWQRAMERRDVNIDGGRPVFLWADEAQNFLHEHDIDYQATARSSRVCTVYLTQNLPNYYAHLNGKDGEYRVKSFLGTLGTKIFHANSDMDTNKYASDLIGQEWVEDISESRQVSGDMSFSAQRSYKLEYPMRPEDFVQLKTGGSLNGYDVQAVVHRQGMPWDSKGRSFKKIIFNQK